MVWLANDEVLGKDVSLHFVPGPVLADDEALALLRHEVKRNRQLIHPSILRVFDFVEEDEWVAVSMDAFTGQTLAECQKAKTGGFFEAADVKPWLTNLCQTLDEAHRIKLVHGDVTPENIIIEDDGRVRVANFGLSVCIKHALGEIDGAGELSAHQSPQQIDGAAPTPIDDVYGVGVLIHKLIVGEPPFSGNAPRKAAPGMAVHRSKLGKAGAPVPPALEKLVASCLEANPGARPQTMGDIVAGLKLTETEAPAPAAPTVAAPEAAAKTAEKARAAVAPPVPADKGKPSNIVEAKAVSKTEPVAGKEEPEVEVLRPAPTKSAKPFAPLDVDTFLSDGGRRSSFPKVALAAAIVILIGGLAVHFSRDKDETSGAAVVAPDKESGAVAKADPAVPTPATNKDTKAPYVGQLPGLGEIKLNPPKKEATPVPQPVVEHRDPPVSVPSVKPEPPKPPVATPAPVITAKTPEVDDARKAFEAAEKAHQDATERKREADTLVADLKKRVEEKAKSLTPLQKAADEVAADQKKRADDLRAAEQGAAIAKQASADKARLAADARKAVADADEALATLTSLTADKAKAFGPIKKAAEEMIAIRKKRDEDARAADLAAQGALKILSEKTGTAEQAAKTATDGEAAGKAKLTAKENAAAELKDLQKSVEEKQRLAGEAAKALAEAAAVRDKHAKAMEHGEAEIAAAKAAADKLATAEAARKAKEIAEVQRMAEEQKAAEAEKVAEAKRMADAKLAADNQKAEAERIAKLKKAADDAKAKFEAELKTLEEAMAKSGAAGHIPAPVVAPPVVKALESPNIALVPNPPKTPEGPTEIVKLDPPIPSTKPPQAGITDAPKTTAIAGPGYVNSLGMKFVPVGEVLVSVWQTRVKDFEAFAKATGLKSTGWRDPGFKQGPDHPVVNISWQEATLFCKWLTGRERKEGTLGANQEYRLPTDLEWSAAVGLGDEPGKTPEARDMSIPDTYPWGTQWPPPPGSGNYTGEETGSDVAIRGYSDGFPWTSPVGSFPPNKSGLYDMGGNVWQWVMDSWNNDSRAKVLRGGSWYNGALKLSLLSSCRVHAAPDSSTDNYGFRVIIAPVAAENGTRPARR